MNPERYPVTTTEKDSTEKAPFIIPQNITKDELVEVLIKSNIPIEQYGIGDAKSIDRLLSEIHKGEAILSIDQNKRVNRSTNVLWLDVLCELSNGNVYVLKEDRQEFKDGRVKHRSLDSSLGEKLAPGEDPKNAVFRALNEELGVDRVDRMFDLGIEARTTPTKTYPGLDSTRMMHKYITILSEDDFNPDGYIEKQYDMTNYYVWELIHDGSKTTK